MADLSLLAVLTAGCSFGAADAATSSETLAAVSDGFKDALRFLGADASPAFVREPEGNSRGG